MKIVLTCMLLLLATTGCYKTYTESIKATVTPGDPLYLKPVIIPVNSQIKGYYEAVPGSYNANKELFPVLIFVHGAGQFGNGSNEGFSYSFCT